MKTVKVRLIERRMESSDMRRILGVDDETVMDDDEFHTPPIADDGIVTRSGKNLFFHSP